MFQVVEAVLETCHLYVLADGVRRFEMFATTDAGMQLIWRERCYAEDRRGFSILQREAYLKEEMQSLLKRAEFQIPTAEETEKPQAWEKELKGLEEKYWFHERAVHKLDREKPKGVWVRDWDSKRKRLAAKIPRKNKKGARVKVRHPQVELVKADCGRAFWDPNHRKPAITSDFKRRALYAGRGGCAKDCGSCEKYVKSHGRGNWAHGHCTTACGCCVRNRGFYRFDKRALMNRGLERGDVPWDSGI